MAKSLHLPEWHAFLSVLRERRRAAGITQTNLARLLGRPQSFVTKVERGERRLDVVEFCAWAKALGISPPRLLAEFECAPDEVYEHDNDES